MNLDRTLRELAADPFAPVDLAELNLHLAAEEYPGLDVPAYLNVLDELADEVTPRLGGSLEDRTAAFAEYALDECGFSGNADDYYDPRNSYLNEVLDRVDRAKPGPAERGALASRVKVRCADSSLLAAREAIQMHGAMGFSDECDVGLYLKRAVVLSAWLGGPEVHRRRYARLAGTEPDIGA